MEKAQESMALFRRIAGQAQSVLGRKKHFYEKLRKSNKSWTDNFLENYTRVDTNIKQLRHDIAIALLDPEWIDLKIVTSHTRSDLIKYLELTNCKDPQFLLLRDGQNSSPLVEASIPTEAISAFRRIAPNQPSEE